MRLPLKLKKAPAALALAAFVLGNPVLPSVWAAPNKAKKAAPERVPARVLSLPFYSARPGLAWNIEGMAYSQFKLSGAVNEFQTADYFANLPVEFRRGKTSGRFTLFHESSHLGDDYIRSTNSTGYRYSVEGLRGVFSLEPRRWMRIYGGGTQLLHRIPSVRPTILQGGFELTSSAVIRRLPNWSAYLAQDFQSKQQNQWNVDSNTELGIRMGAEGIRRLIRAYIGHYEGHSPFGQFRTRRVSYNNIGAGFYF